jgi:D-xylose transport system permease protein
MSSQPTIAAGVVSDRPAETRSRRAISPRDFSMAMALAVIWIYFSIRQPAFLSSRNLSMLAIELSITATLALGMLLVMLPGHIDLSAGSGVGLLGAVAAVLVFSPRDLIDRLGFVGRALSPILQTPWPAPLAMAAACLFALLLWTLMSRLIVKTGIPAFIVTLGGLQVFRGLHWYIIGSQTIPVSLGGQTNAYSALTTYYVQPRAGYILAAAVTLVLIISTLRARARRQAHRFATADAELTFLRLFVSAQTIFLFVLICNQYQGIPLSAVVLSTVAFIVYILTQHTPFGRYLYAIGGNEEAAVLSGVPVQRVVITAFALMGFIVALTGFMQTAYGGATTSTVGSLMELDAIAACVIGGTSLRGGRGTVLGTLFGALIMASLLNGMTLLAVSPEMKFVARGIVLTLAVWLDVKLSRKSQAH